MGKSLISFTDLLNSSLKSTGTSCIPVINTMHIRTLRQLQTAAIVHHKNMKPSVILRVVRIEKSDACKSDRFL